MMTAQDVEPRVWVGCLACYNAGRLVGEWVEGAEAAEVNAGTLHLIDPEESELAYAHEELWVFDHEGYGGLIDGECSPAEAQAKAELLASVDDSAAFAAFAEHYGAEYATVETFEEAFAGVFDAFEDYATELADEMIAARDAGNSVNGDDLLTRYFAYDRFARDLLLGGDYYAVPTGHGTVYVFAAV